MIKRNGRRFFESKNMRKRNFCIALSVLLLSGCQSFGPKVTAPPEVLAEFTFSDTENGILLPVMFQDENYKFLLDTGTDETILEDSFKNKLIKQLEKRIDEIEKKSRQNPQDKNLVKSGQQSEKESTNS